ncbi:MAG: glucoamylase family protein [Phycisphaerales bacterium]
MKSFTRRGVRRSGRPWLTAGMASGVSVILSGGCSSAQTTGLPESLRPEDVVISDDARPRPPFHFSDEDEALLDEIEHASFLFFWKAVSPETGMVYDRTSSDVISVGGVGFQLSALPIGVERGWITREEGRERAVQILSALEREPTNRKAGLFYHFLEPDDARPRRVGAELVVSTIDSAVLFAGMMTAGSYFGGDVQEIGDRLWRAADWSFFLHETGEAGLPGGYLSLGWRPTDDADPTGDGALIGYSWIDSGDEHRLVTFMGVSAPEEAHRVPPERYFALRRQLGTYEGVGPLVWFPYSGALFTAFFANCWIDYAHLGVDDPASWGAPARSRVDWWENSRRTVNLHRAAARENARGLPTLGEDAWGLSACDAPDGYLVAGVFPHRVEMVGAKPERDYATYVPEDRMGDGTVPPYAAGASIIFEPGAAVAALRLYRTLCDELGSPLVWRDPADGGYGLRDAFNMRGPDGSPWVAADDVAIDHGPMLLGIENARTGLIWRLFASHPSIRDGLSRLRLE